MSDPEPAPLRPTRAVVDLDAVRGNVARLADTSAPAAVCAVVKADGYGHGALEVARTAVEAGAEWLAVAMVEEGEQLRDAGLTVPVLVLAEPPPAAADRLLAADLTASVYTPAFGRALDAAAEARGTVARAHLKADTGMARVGAVPEDWGTLLTAAAGWRHVTVEGLWTHLACADDPDLTCARGQLAAFDDFVSLARGHGLRPAVTHVANSAATLRLPEARRELVRVGIAVYGLSPGPHVAAADHGLRPALRLETRVAFAKRIAAGTPVSYGHRWRAPADGWLATLPVGYADGVPRSLSNRAHVLLGGAPRPVVGSVCMDQLLVWCGADEVRVGDEAVLVGTQGGARVAVEDWAELAGTITYEIATGVGGRVPRTWIGDRGGEAG